MGNQCSSMGLGKKQRIRAKKECPGKGVAYRKKVRDLGKRKGGDWKTRPGRLRD